MTDQSHLDSKYFIDKDYYNCPFCNRNHLPYRHTGKTNFDWSNEKTCYAWFVTCSGCYKTSMHLTYKDLRYVNERGDRQNHFKSGIELDDAFFHSVPTSFFVADDRIPEVLRELITEAEGCRKMNHLVGASACTRKAIYELLKLHEAQGANYDDKIKDLQTKFPAIDKFYFEALKKVKDMTSDHVHEQSWVTWDSKHLTMFLESLKPLLHEIYVAPKEKEARLIAVRSLHGAFSQEKDADSEPPLDEN